MDDILGRVAAIFLAAVILCGMPLIYMEERAKTASQLYLLTLDTEFVDDVCNTGMITRERYETFLKKVSAMPGIYQITLLHEQKDLIYEKGVYSYTSRYFDETDVKEKLDAGEAYLFYRGDYIRVAVVRVDAGSIFPWLSDETVHIFYGGTVKYETM